MDPDVRAKILDRPRARELERFERPDPTLAELRARYGRDVSDEHLILRAIVGDDAVEAIAGAPRPVPLLWTSSLRTSALRLEQPVAHGITPLLR